MKRNWRSRAAKVAFVVAVSGPLALGARPALAQIETGPSQPVGPTAPPTTTPSQKPAGQQPAGPAPASGLGIRQIKTKDLRLLYFDPTETYLTPYVGRALENSIAFQEKLYDWKPWEPTTVLLKDFADYGNAAARASPNNGLLFDIAPISQTFETFSAGERFFTLANHEETHVATMDAWNARDAFWRSVFHGKPMPVEAHPESILYNYLTTPRVNVPRWYLEGSAVFMETWMAGGFGRAQGGYDEMVWRAMVRDNARFFSPLGLEAEGDQIDFQVGVNDYLYGTRFFSYLALTRSPEKVIDWLKRGPDSEAYYESQFKHVFGESLNGAWKDWVVWEHQFQQANLASVQQYPMTPLKRLTNRALGSVSRSFYDPATNSLVGAFRYPGVIGHIGVLSLDTGQIRKLTEIKGPMLYKVTSLAYDQAGHRAWYTIDNYAFRSIMQVDLRTGRTHMLIHQGRIGDLAYDPADQSLWGLRHLNGLATLVRIPPPYKDWTQVHTFPFGEVPFDLDISPDGTKLSTSVGEVNGDQFVRVFNIADLSGNDFPQPIAELKLGSSTPEGFVFSPDSKYLYGSAYYTGVSNLYRFEVATQKVDAVSNAATGLFRPIPRPDGSLIAFEYTGQGFTPVALDPKPLDDLGAIKFLGAEIADKQPIVRTWTVGSPANVPLDSMITASGPYIPWREITLDSIYPVVEGYKGHFAFGAHAVFEDPMQLNQLLATVAYSPAGDLPEAEQWHADLEYHTFHWRFRYWHNNANFYDLFGPTDRSLKGDAVIVDYKTSPIYEPPRQLDFTAEVAGYVGLDTLPGAQNIPTKLDSDIETNKVGLNYVDVTRSLGAVDDEKGLRWNLNAETDFGDGKTFPSLRGGLSFGVPLGGDHTSIWFYTAGGAVGGDVNNPLSAFYLGSFGNNYVDDGEVKRYRDYDSFPGFGIDAITARHFAKGVVELNLPPLRFSDVGAPNFFLSNLRPAIFSGLLYDDPGIGPVRTLGDVGGQADLNFTVALRLPMVLSLGYAAGLESGHREHNEVMLSLKIL